MSNIDKQALREAAEKATPGEWWIDSHGMAMVAHHNDNTFIVFVTDGEQMGREIRHEDTGNLSHWRNDNDASFIAAANPATVLALLDELDAKDKLNAELMEKQRLIDICQGQGLEHRIAAEKRAEAAEKRIAELERDETQLIEERDSAEKALADMYEAAMGERPEWSNLFGYAEAIDDVAQHVNFLDIAAVTGKGE